MNAPLKSRKSRAAYLKEIQEANDAREDIEIPPFTLYGHDISGVDDHGSTSDSTHRSAGSHGKRRFDPNNSGFGGLSNFSAISDLTLSSGGQSPHSSTHSPAFGHHQHSGSGFVPEQSLSAFMDISQLARGVKILPATKMMR